MIESRYRYVADGTERRRTFNHRNGTSAAGSIQVVDPPAFVHLSRTT
jgi:hypothetical protein